MDEQQENFMEGIANSLVAKIECGEGMNIHPGIVMFRLMYPLAEVPSGKKCDTGCDCGGENDEIAVVCTANN